MPRAVWPSIRLERKAEKIYPLDRQQTDFNGKKVLTFYSVVTYKVDIWQMDWIPSCLPAGSYLFSSGDGFMPGILCVFSPIASMLEKAMEFGQSDPGSTFKPDTRFLIDAMDWCVFSGVFEKIVAVAAKRMGRYVQEEKGEYRIVVKLLPKPTNILPVSKKAWSHVVRSPR